ncbi:MAG: hypothetical protein AAB410_05205 [Patescibacteria group bacterium]
MNFFRNSTNKLLIASLLTTAIFAIGLLNFMSMNHSAQGHEACIPAIAQGADCSVPQGNEACLDYHLGIISKLSQAVPSGGKLALLALVLLPIFAWFIQRFHLLLRHFLHIRIRMRWLWEDLVYSISKQFWFLALQEKRDPGFALL